MSTPLYKRILKAHRLKVTPATNDNHSKIATDEVSIPVTTDLSPEQFRKMLSWVDPFCKYPEWFRLLGAIKSEYGEKGRALAESWSRGELLRNNVQSGNSPFEQDEFDRVWKELKRGGDKGHSGANGATLLKKAQDNGWQNVAKKATEDLGGITLRFHQDRERDRREPDPMIIEGLLPVGGLGAIVGMPGDGKTLISMELTRCIAMNEPFAGHKVRPGLVAYACTDAPGSTERRMLAIPTKAAEKLISIAELPRLPGGLKALNRAIRQINARDDGRVRLLIIDTYDSAREHTDGGYAGQDGMTENVLRGLRRIATKRRLAVLVVHHATRQDGGRARGPVPFDANMDWIGIVEKGNDGPVLRSTKCRDGECGLVGSWSIGTVQVGDKPVPVLQESRTDAAELLKGVQDRKVLETAHSCLATGDSVTLAVLGKALGQKGKGAISRIVERLRENGLMNVDDYSLTRAGIDSLDIEDD